MPGSSCGFSRSVRALGHSVAAGTICPALPGTFFMQNAHAPIRVFSDVFTARAILTRSQYRERT